MFKNTYKNINDKTVKLFMMHKRRAALQLI